MPLSDIVFDLLSWLLGVQFQSFHLVFSITIALIPTGQGPNVGVTPTAKSINSHYTFRDWGNDHWLDPWTRQAYCESDYSQDYLLPGPPGVYDDALGL